MSTANQNPQNAQSSELSVGSNWGRVEGHLSDKTREKDTYGMSTAPLSIFENQVITVGLHNLMKSFTPNLLTIRALSLGTKFIPK